VKRIAVAALGLLLLLPATADAGTLRPRPNEVPRAETAVAPNDFQLYNDYASPEWTYQAQRVVVHYVVAGIDAPALNDDDTDGVPDYVERVGDAADRSLAYYERRGFRAPLPDTGGPDRRPDIYISRFSPGTLGVSLPGGRAAGGAFVVVANNLDPSADRSFASLYATVAHELFHLTQFAYFGPDSDPPIPGWILEGTAAAMETRVYPELDDIVSTLQLRRWLTAPEQSMTTQSYGSQLLWLKVDREQPRFLPALLSALAARPISGQGERIVAATYARVAGRPFADAFHRFAVSVADRIDPVAAPRRAALGPLSLRVLRAPDGRVTVTGAAATLVYRIEGAPGEWPRKRTVAPSRDGTFRVTTAPGKTALLVVSNGGERAISYTVDAR